jgi:hypothetical protein
VLLRRAQQLEHEFIVGKARFHLLFQRFTPGRSGCTGVTCEMPIEKMLEVLEFAAHSRTRPFMLMLQQKIGHLDLVW